MELLYIYVREKKNIKDCEFNFSPNYKFMFNRETKTFSLDRKEQLPSGWFGSHIKNITALIGKNGAGKSNLIECIIHALCYQNGGIIIYSNENKLWVNQPSFSDMYKFDFEVNRMNRWGGPFNSCSNEMVMGASVVYYSPNIDRIMEIQRNSLSRYTDLSNAAILRYPKHQVYSVPDFALSSDVDVMITTDVFKVLLFFVYAKKFKYDLPIDIKVPDSIIVRLIKFDKDVINDPVYNELIKNLDESFQSCLKYYFLSQIYGKQMQSQTWDASTTMDEIFLYLNHNESFRPNLYKLLIEAYQEGILFYQTQERGLMKEWNYMEFSIKVDRISEKLLSALYHYYFPYALPYICFGSFKSQKGIVNDSINIRWNGISSGELAFLTFFARLLGSFFEKQGEINNTEQGIIEFGNKYDGNTVILILDEADNMMHPDWQQKFLDVLLDSLHLFFPNIYFQIFLASHSPILISDLPKSNVIFMRKDENGLCKVDESMAHKETFGANIYSLFNDSFFLDGIPIGKFAQRKITELFDKVIYSGLSSQEILNDIFRIGEPVLKESLLKKFRENSSKI